MDRLQDQDRPAASLMSLLHESMVGWDVLEDRYGALLRLVDTVLGVVPNCDRYLEIWPPAFRTYSMAFGEEWSTPAVPPGSPTIDRQNRVANIHSCRRSPA